MRPCEYAFKYVVSLTNLPFFAIIILKDYAEVFMGKWSFFTGDRLLLN